jgi:hypothetical protein
MYFIVSVKSTLKGVHYPRTKIWVHEYDKRISKSHDHKDAKYMQPFHLCTYTIGKDGFGKKPEIQITKNPAIPY